MATPQSDRERLLPVLGEVFREHGYEGASLALISAATGLGKGSLYHHFPGGKEEMATSVLAEIDSWFEAQVFAPLRAPADPHAAIAVMFTSVDAYFRTGRRVCLVGALALSETRDRFATAVCDYFARWVSALSDALRRAGHGRKTATMLAEEIVGGIQGAIVLSRALDDPDVFRRILSRLSSMARTL
jgi:AcrR family transcriptional regulator